jgi:hypothetical protein
MGTLRHVSHSRRHGTVPFHFRLAISNIALARKSESDKRNHGIVNNRNSYRHNSVGLGKRVTLLLASAGVIVVAIFVFYVVVVIPPNS